MKIINSAIAAEMAADMGELESSSGQESSQNNQFPFLYGDFVAHQGVILSVLVQCL